MMKRGNLVVIAFSAVALGFSGITGVAGAAGQAKTGKKYVQEQQAVQKETQAGKKPRVKVTFVELGSVSCVPCRMMQPVMDEIEKECGDQVQVVFHDVWTKEGAPYGDRYNIRAIPTQVFLDKDGKEFFRHTGFFPKEEIIKVLRKQGVR